MNTKQLASYFDVTIRTVRRWVKAGCPVERKRCSNNIGYELKFDVAEVAKWKEQQIIGRMGL